MTDKVLMPKDSASNSIPVLGFKDESYQKVTSNVGGTARNATAFTSTVISVYADAPVRLRFGSSGVTATQSSALIPASTWIDIAIGNRDGKQATHLAAIIPTSGAATDVHIVERE